jgi:hypothetical protein
VRWEDLRWCQRRTRRGNRSKEIYLSSINPSIRSKSDRIAERIKEYKDHTSVVGGAIFVVGVGEG